MEEFFFIGLLDDGRNGQYGQNGRNGPVHSVHNVHLYFKLS